MEAKDTDNTKNFLVLGPWFHSQINRDGSSLGALRWEGDTALQVRRDVIKPLFDQYLKENAPRAATPPVWVFNTGEKRWEKHDRWPLAGGDSGVASTPLFLAANGGLSFTASATMENAFDEYVSDPAKPVPYLPRPVKFSDGDVWRRWLVTDQRFVADRPDVLVYQTEPLVQPLRIAGAPVVHLLASTSGTDSDWVVKLIDVFPDEVPSQPELGGYQLPISLEIFRGRYRESFERPTALAAGPPLRYTFALPHANHTFQAGHRIMVHIQSTLFPLYDRNPQKFVPNIFLAEPADYQKAVQRIHRGGPNGTFIDLPIVAN
jgi:putative CocE/NonD family hydrolase